MCYILWKDLRQSVRKSDKNTHKSDVMSSDYIRNCRDGCMNTFMIESGTVLKKYLNMDAMYKCLAPFNEGTFHAYDRQSCLLPDFFLEFLLDSDF